MLKTKDFIIAINYEIGEGFAFEWKCYGDYACCLRWDKEDLFA